MTVTIKSKPPEEFAICMATDAFRLAMGMRGKRHQVEDVIRWLRLMEADTGATSGDSRH